MERKILAVHDGGHHPDDVFGAAMLRGVFGDFEIARTRDARAVEQAWAAVDVGGVDDAAALRFDHHQKGFARKRPNGVPYASAGLVWSRFGAEFAKKALGEGRGHAAQAVAEAVDAELIAHIDAEDSGYAIPAEGRCGISAALDALNPTWLETAGLDKEGRAALHAARFEQAVDLALGMLTRACETAAAEAMAADLVDAAPRLFGGRLMVLDRPGLPWQKLATERDAKLLLAAYPDSGGAQWQLGVVPKKAGSFEARMDLPKAWAGLRSEDLAAVCGVSDAVFCHNGRFVCGAVSKQGAVEMARLALESEGFLAKGE